MGLEPDRGHVEYQLLTGLGPLKAAFMAGGVAALDHPDSGFSTVEVVSVEEYAEPDTERDLLDWWGLDR